MCFLSFFNSLILNPTMEMKGRIYSLFEWQGLPCIFSGTRGLCKNQNFRIFRNFSAGILTSQKKILWSYRFSPCLVHSYEKLSWLEFFSWFLYTRGKCQNSMVLLKLLVRFGNINIILTMWRSVIFTVWSRDHQIISNILKL